MKISCIPSQSYKMRTLSNVGHPIDREGPPETVEINSFYISETTITNEQFTKFIDESGYITDAEKIGSSFVFSEIIDDDIKEKTPYSNTSMSWWLDISGAY